MTEPYGRHTFAGRPLHPAWRWLHEPARWAPGERGLTIEPDAETDFWQATHYGFRRDNGHVLFTDVTGDFVLATHVRFRPAHQYDQAGLMIRFSPSCWLKTSVEHEPGRAGRLGAVVTNDGFSDWSTQPFPAAAREVWLRVRREGQDYIVDASREGRDWEQLRMAHLGEDQDGAAVGGGLYACSPTAGGFVAEFAYLSLERGRLTAR